MSSRSDAIDTPEPIAPLPHLIDERYVVEREIGRGGFGRVVVARDGRLRRQVAIKLLVAGIRTPADEKRLEREARLTGSLNHPNIVAVHDVGRSGGEPFIVTEFLQGAPLRAVLREGPLPVARALELCRDLARGLAPAHERGIIHRDLKPENLFVTSGGPLKILDFGVAFVPRTTGAAPGTVGDEASASSMQLVAGTIGYAAPEQLRGQEVDARADLFSLGAVLHEMLTGRRAFDGATRFDVGHAVLHGEPGPLPPGTPPPVSAIVRRCLEKDPDARFQTAKDLLFNLELAEASLGGPRRSRISRWWPLWVAGAATLLGTMAVVRELRPAEKPSFRQVTFFGGAVTSARFGRGGDSVFYTEAWDGSPARVYQTRIGSSDFQRLEVSDAILAGASRTGEIALLLAPQFQRGDFIGTLARTTLAGAAPRELQKDVDYADWSPDGGNLAVVRTVEGKSRLEYPLGHLLLESIDRLVGPRISPDGERVALLVYPRMGQDQPSVGVVERNGQLRVLSRGWRDARGLAWAPDGKAVWFTATASGHAGAQSELRSVTLSGKERTLLQEAGNLELQDVAGDGRALVTKPVGQAGIAYLDDSGASRDLSFLDQALLSDLSRDGKLVLFSALGSGLAAPSTVYVRATDGSAPVPVGTGFGAALSPDGSEVLSIPVNAGAQKPLSLLPVGAGTARTVDLRGITAVRGGFLPDGRRLVVVGQEEGKALKLYVVDPDTGVSRAISAEGIYFGYFSASPDGKWVAAVDSSFRTALYPVEGGSPVALPEVPPGHFPIGWTQQGALLLIRPPDLPMPIYRFDLGARRMDVWRTLQGPPGASGIRTVFATPDGRALAYNFGTKRTHLYVIEGLR